MFMFNKLLVKIVESKVLFVMLTLYILKIGPHAANGIFTSLSKATDTESTFKAE